MKYLIIGRTGTGKDRLANELAKRGLKVLKSYATRKPRYEGEDTHIFITKEEAASYKDKIATTTINDVNYFATRKQLDESDVYIIDPNGAYELIKNCPDISFHVIHMVSDKELTRERAIHRGSDPDKEAAIFDSRYDSEDEEFSAFEKILEKEEPLGDNCSAFITCTNDGDKKLLYDFAGYLYGLFQEFKNLKFITEQAITLGIIDSSEIGYISLIRKDDETRTPIQEPIENFVDVLLSDEASYLRLMHAYLASTTLYFEP